MRRIAWLADKMAVASVVVFGLLSPALSQELKQVAAPPTVGTFWLLSAEVNNRPSPPYPFDPYNGTLPVYEMKGSPGQYLVGDSPEEYQQLLSAKKSRALRMNSLNSPPSLPGDDEGDGEDSGGGIS